MTSATNLTFGGEENESLQWDHPNVKWALIVSIGAGLCTGLGGALVFFPDLLRRVPQATVLAVSLALSAGVMIYVSFIEIFYKSLDAISERDDIFSEGGASAVTTACFFSGMLVCALLEVLVHWMTHSGEAAHLGCPAHGDVLGIEQTSSAAKSCEQTASAEDAPMKVNAAPVREVEIVVNDKTNSEHSTAPPESPEPSRQNALAVDVGGDLLGNEAESASLSRMGLMTALAIAIHNFPEGLATFMATLTDEKLGASLGVAIAVHNIPEGLCVAMPIYYATGSKMKGFLWSLASGITEPIGGILGFAVLQPVFTPLVFGIVFAMVGGMMVFIVCHELLPSAHKYMKNGAKTTMWLIIGMVIMATSLVLFVL